MIWYFPVQNYFSTKYNTKMKKKLHPTIAENSSPHRGEGGTFDPGFEKTLSYFCRLLWEKWKKRRRRKFRNRDYFYTKNSAKMQKMANRKLTLPPGGGTENVFNLGIPPPGGGLQKIPPPLGGFTPSSIFKQTIYTYILYILYMIRFELQCRF